jgi:nickel superoxide dismutase
MKKKLFQLCVVFAALLFVPWYALGHCEIPCGIYDDEMRLNLIAEHTTTLEKSMKEIKRLVTGSPFNYNQMVRWIMNKEDHANQLQEIVTQYFMTQRIKPDQKGYEKQLVLLHKMLVAAMKCKQTTDPVHIGELRSLLKDFREAYLGDHGHHHDK